ncbi:histidinol-phosphatase HisJ family protein [Anoxynatronum buryatiense]|uniref:Histidinol-phosphatase n=1 Tax=Anoxynatronum buryatiense TaxID=489973 RepID=A0AA45WTM4_9CLOT|nr:histidinol-phosphatase HisJ family protein [Anoxynatronum buryatiense]SMP39782.1 histidinol-phosphatase (PHP family) [Anoxynatronum buryatiense]
MFDFHVHTHHSFDASHPMDLLVERAIQLGIQQLCFTDHTDYDYDGAGSHFSFSYQAFFDEITRTKQQYSQQIEVLAGVEFGLQPHVLQNYAADAEKWPFDYIIGSLHSAKKTDIYTGPYFQERDQRHAYLDYYDDMLQIIGQGAPFDAIGHFDMIKRYGSFESPLPLTDFSDIAATIFRQLAAQGKGIEVNTSGFRYGLNDAHPSRDLLALYKECGGEVIVTGSDTHQLDELAYKFPTILHYLDDLGFKYVTTFKQRKPTFHSIHKLL